MRRLRVLNVAEKNDAAKEISRIMSRGSSRKREGRSKYNKIYEFAYNLFGNDCQMSMTSVSGHLMNNEFSGCYKKWTACSPLTLFTAKVERYCPENYIPIKVTLEEEAAVSNVLVLWTDGDREGESIAHEIMEVCCCVNSRLDVYRARFSEITPQSIYRACQHLDAIDQRIVDAVDVRQELDLRIGAAFTRFQTLYLQKKFPESLADRLISYGSCQFPTLGFVTERFKQIEDFIPESFHKIKVTYETDDDVVVFRWKRIRIFRKLACQILYEMCLENPTAHVLSISSRHKSKWRPQALDTVELEKLASRKLHISATETMRIAEKLYTKGFISYPRTETNIFPPSMDLNAVVQEQTQDHQWGGFAADILAQGGPTPRNGSKTDNAHPPIHPTKHTSQLQNNEQRIYELVVRHFLACCSKDAQGQETTVEIEIAGERFTAQGLMIIARNYLDVYPYDRWSDKTIPVFQQGQTFQPTSLEMVEGETSPPSPLQEADLIALMEKHGIGTDATHAEHIETIKHREYVGCTHEGSFLPAQLGLGLVNGYDAMGFQMSKPHLRAELEADLKRICNGQKRKEDVLPVQIEKYRDVFVNACEQAHLLDEALGEFFGEPADVPQEEATPVMEDPVVRRCPLCTDTDMLLRVSKDEQYFVGCAAYPSCRACLFFPKSVISVTITDLVCSKCHPAPVFKVMLKCKRGTLPPHVIQEDGGYLVCVGGCDRTITEALDMRLRTNSVDSSSTSGSTRRPSTQLSQQLPRRNMPQPFPTQPVDSGVSVNSSGSQRHQHHERLGTSTGDMPSSYFSARLSQSANGPSASGATHIYSSSSSDTGGGTVCDCRLSAVRRTTRKPGPNQGRDFFSCLNGHCKFFLWSDSEQNGSTGVTNSFVGGSSNWTPTSQHPVQQQSEWEGTMAQTRHHNMLTASNGGSTVCSCGQPVVRKTTRKQGPNQGRDFLCCQGGCCNFFMWADSEQNDSKGVPPSFGGGSHAGNSASQHPVPRQHWTDQPILQGRYNNENCPTVSRPSVVCSCGQPAAQRTTHKSGPNQGRDFFCCQNNCCNFFMWSDSEQVSARNTAGSLGSVSCSISNGSNTSSRFPVQPLQPSMAWTQQRNSGPADSGGPILCRCGEPTTKRTTRKQGPNQGRDFFCCVKPQENRCDFFMWADVNPSDASQMPGVPVVDSSSSWSDSKRVKGKGRGRSFHAAENDRWSGGPQSVRKRKCGNCHQLGHDRRTCPHLN